MNDTNNLEVIDMVIQETRPETRVQIRIAGPGGNRLVVLGEAKLGPEHMVALNSLIELASKTNKASVLTQMLKKSEPKLRMEALNSILDLLPFEPKLTWNNGNRPSVRGCPEFTPGPNPVFESHLRLVTLNDSRFDFLGSITPHLSEIVELLTSDENPEVRAAAKEVFGRIVSTLIGIDVTKKVLEDFQGRFFGDSLTPFDINWVNRCMQIEFSKENTPDRMKARLDALLPQNTISELPWSEI